MPTAALRAYYYYEMDWLVKKFGWFKFGERLVIRQIRQTFPLYCISVDMQKAGVKRSAPTLRIADFFSKTKKPTL